MPVASSDAAFEDYRWEQASISIEPHTLLTDVASTPVGWVSVGVRLNVPTAGATSAPDSDPFENLFSGVIWTSTDGRGWTRLPDAPTFEGARMTKVVSDGAGALVFGIGGVCLPDACSGLPPNGGTIVWSTSDGSSWERLADTGLADGATNDVAPVDGGLVAVGYVGNDGSKPDGDAFTNPTDAAVWRSLDGRHWTAVRDLPIADRLTRVSAQGSSLLALGSRDDSTVIWTSSDGGLTWVEGPNLEEGCCSSSAIKEGLAIVTSSTDVDDRVDGTVSLADGAGRPWVRTAPPIMRGYRPALVQTLGTSIVIFGRTTHLDEIGLLTDDLPIAFSSLDGLDWTTTAAPSAWDGKAPMSVASRGQDLVAIVRALESVDGPPEDLTYTVWIGTAPE